MLILTTDSWQDYELIDSGNYQKLERFGKYILVRPDPQILWKPSLLASQWKKADAKFIRTSEDRGRWEPTNVPDKWLLEYQGLKFFVKLSPFKHTGVFPEQSAHWEFIRKQIIESKLPETESVLNLFGYTGIASLVAAKAGAKVTHVDASYQAIGWARENQQASGLEDKPIKWILDDCLKFCQREVRRKAKYSGIIMDPPVYGHGPKGEIWKFNESFPALMESCSQLLSDNPSFVIVNSYAVSTSAITLDNVLKDFLLPLGGKFECGELALKERSGRLLSTGIFARWSNINF